jgi:hypothetical protein
MGFKCLASLVREKINIKFLLAYLTTLSNSYDRPKVSSNCTGFPSLLLVDFLQCTFMVGFRNNFQDYRRLSKQLLASQAAIGEPEQAPRRGLLEGFSQLVNGFKEAPFITKKRKI